jgi:hypothetical protein
MHAQRRRADEFAEGLDQWRRGVDSIEAEAARVNLASLFNLWGTINTKDQSWSK